MKKVYIGVGIVLIFIFIGVLFWINRGEESIRKPEISDKINNETKNENIIAETTGVNCFENVNSSDLELEYEDFGMKKYKLPQGVIDCIKENYKRSFDIYIQKGDYYIDKNNKLILYKLTQFTGNNIIKVNGLIDIK